MIGRDCISAKQRLDLPLEPLAEWIGYECVGCGRTSVQIQKEEGWNGFDFDDNSKTTNSGLWYCHIDCYRDSK